MIRKLILFLVIMISFGSTAFAYQNNVGVVLFGASEYSEDKFLSEVSDLFQSDRSKLLKIHVGAAEQANYQAYWFNKGFLDEPVPTTNDLMEYVALSKYDEILFIYAKEPKNRIYRAGLYGTGQMYETTVELKGYLVGKDKLITSYTSTNKDKALNDESRACFNAFKKSIKEIHKEFMDDKC